MNTNAITVSLAKVLLAIDALRDDANMLRYVAGNFPEAKLCDDVRDLLFKASEAIGTNCDHLEDLLGLSDADPRYIGDEEAEEN